MRFYKSPGETGTHVGRIWTEGGTQLAQVTFTGETTSGWQTEELVDPADDHARPDLRHLRQPQRLLPGTTGGLAQDPRGPVAPSSAATASTTTRPATSRPAPGTTQLLRRLRGRDRHPAGPRPARVSVTTPADAPGVAMDSSPRPRSPARIDPATITASVHGHPRTAARPATVSYDAGSNIAHLDPTADLTPTQLHGADLTTAIARRTASPSPPRHLELHDRGRPGSDEPALPRTRRPRARRRTRSRRPHRHGP